MKYPDKAQFEKANVFGKGNPNTAYALYFKGNSFLNLLLKPGEPFVVANVTFEPSCRNKLARSSCYKWWWPDLNLHLW